MSMVFIRVYGELNRFVPRGWRMRLASMELVNGATVQDIIESAGIPCNLIDLILVNGNPAGFTIELQANDRVSLYPEFRSLDISPLNLISRHGIH